MKALIILSSILLCSCANVDYVEYVNPNLQLKKIVQKHGLNRSGLNCIDGKSDCDGAIREINQLLLSHPDNDDINLVHANLLLKSGKNDQANYTLNKLVNQNKPQLISLMMAIELNILKNNMNRAVSLSDKALKLYGAQPKVYAQLAAIYYAKGDYIAAGKYLDISKSTGLSYPLYYYNLALISEKQKDIKKACNYYAKSLEYDASYEQSIHNRSRLSINMVC